MSVPGSTGKHDDANHGGGDPSRIMIETHFIASSPSPIGPIATVLSSCPHQQHPPSTTDSWFEIAQREAWFLAELAFPTSLILLGTFAPGFLTASLIGRNYGAAHLSGFTLATLTTNLSTLSIVEGLFSASDTLSPQAYGAGQNPHELGLLAFRGFVVSMVAVLPLTAILVIHMRSILVWLGQDVQAAGYAEQCVMAPSVVSAVISACFILPTALHFYSQWLGFQGTALAMVCFQASQAGIALLYMWILRPHDPQTWPGFGAFWQALEWKAMKAYVVSSHAGWLEMLRTSNTIRLCACCCVTWMWSLGVGGVLANSEWIDWEALSLLIGTFGVIPLSVHTVPTQVLTVAYTLPYGLGAALSIRVGTTLPLQVHLAKMIAYGGFFAGFVMVLLVTLLLYTKRRLIFAMFTTDEDILEGCEAIWVQVCATHFAFGLFGIISGILVALGMQWTLGLVNFISSWCLGLPVLYFVAIVQGGGLVAAWNCVSALYFLIDAALIFKFLRKDWASVSSEIRRREGMMPLRSDALQLALSADRYGSLGNSTFSA